MSIASSSDDGVSAAGERLRGIARVAAALDLPRIRDDAVNAATRLGEGQFYVACVGQFKRGKSTLIDALLDAPLLPAGIVPVTAVPTIVRHGERLSARVRFAPRTAGASAHPGAEWQTISPESLPQFVSEEFNPGNERGVLAVEVFIPSPMLRTGMCLVDTPGVGSVFEANSEATRAFIPQIDAAIVVIGADPPVSGEELELIGAVSSHVKQLLVVLNKADRVTAEERRVAMEFARRVIERRVGHPIPTVYEISALERLDGGTATRDWDRFVAALDSLVATSGKRIVAESARRALRRLRTAVQHALDDERAALDRSSEENRRHVEELQRVVADGERALGDLGALFTVEQQRLSRRFADSRRDFLRDALPRGRAELTNSAARIRAHFGPRRRRAVMRQAQHIAHALLEPWLAREQEDADARFRHAMERFTLLAQDFLDRLATTSAPSEFAALRGALDDQLSLRARSQFLFNDVITVAEPASPLRFMADVALGVLSPRTLDADGARFLDWLLELNSSRVQSDVDERVAEGRRELEQAIRALLKDVGSRARRALARADAARASGEGAVKAAVDRIAQLEEELRKS